MTFIPEDVPEGAWNNCTTSTPISLEDLNAAVERWIATRPHLLFQDRRPHVEPFDPMRIYHKP